MVELLCQPEIGQLGEPAGALVVQQDVARLQVAMHEPALMGHFQPGKALQHDGPKRLERKFFAACAHHVGQASAVAVVRDEIKRLAADTPSMSVAIFGWLNSRTTLILSRTCAVPGRWQPYWRP